MMRRYGMSESEARGFLERELGRVASTTSFYWESEELEEVLDLVIDAVSKLIVANNAQLAAHWARYGASDLKI